MKFYDKNRNTKNLLMKETADKKEEGIENITVIGHIEGKRNGRKQQGIFVTNLYKWMEEKLL